MKRRGGDRARKPECPDAAVTFHSAAVTAPATWVNLWGSWPAQRYYQASAYDTDRKVMVIFGGRYNTNGPYYGDTWEWNSARGDLDERTPAATSPANRSGHVMVFDPVRKKTFLFGGWQPEAELLHPGAVGVGRDDVDLDPADPPPAPSRSRVMTTTMV